MTLSAQSMGGQIMYFIFLINNSEGIKARMSLMRRVQTSRQRPCSTGHSTNHLRPREHRVIGTGCQDAVVYLNSWEIISQCYTPSKITYTVV